MWINLPAALALVASLTWLLQQHEARVKASMMSGMGMGMGLHRRHSTRLPHAHAPQAHHAHHNRAHSTGGLDSKGREGRWRERVGSDLVAEAWEVLCGSILQEVCEGDSLVATVHGQVHKCQSAYHINMQTKANHPPHHLFPAHHAGL